jgi:ATP-dependent DNA helicase 2 subunit 1
MGVRYGLIAEQKKGVYKYFVDLGDRMELAQSKTAYVDDVRSPFLSGFP